PEQLPGLLLTPPGGTPADPVTWIDGAARLLASWAESAPALPVAVAVTAGDLSRYLDAAPDSRAKALVREGAVPVARLTAAGGREGLGEFGGPSAAWAPAVERLAADGASAELAASFAAAARHAAAAPADAAADDAARSAAERFLFDRLESL